MAKQLGNTGEAAAGIARRRVQIPSATETAKFRLPDQLAPTFLREIKNVKHQSLTNQLRDFIDFSAKTNRQFILEVRPTTTFSKPLQRLIDEGKVAVVRNPNL